MDVSPAPPPTVSPAAPSSSPSLGSGLTPTCALHVPPPSAPLLLRTRSGASSSSSSSSSMPSNTTKAGAGGGGGAHLLRLLLPSSLRASGLILAFSACFWGLDEVPRLL